VSMTATPTRRIVTRPRSSLTGSIAVPGLSGDAEAATGGRRLQRTAPWREWESDRLMRELYLNIPVMGRAISILSALAGEPQLIGTDDAHTAELQQWSEDVPSGWSGTGLCSFLEQLRWQRLWHGRAFSEAQISEGRDGVEGIWVYRSENFDARPGTNGELEIIQLNATSNNSNVGGRLLDNLQACVSLFDAQDGGTLGQPLFLACPTIGQIWAETLMAFKATQRRMGIPVYHVQVKLPEGFRDQEITLEDGTRTTKSEQFAGKISRGLKTALKSQIERGVANDLVTADGVTITILGLNGEIIGTFEIGKRQLIEEIVVASDVTPSLFGYQWSTTERMSGVQMKKLVGRLWSIRRQDAPIIRKFVDLHQRLRGDSRPWIMKWPDTNLADLTETATAALNDANAKLRELLFATFLWKLGIWDQTKVAEHSTGSEQVVKAYDEPPIIPTPTAGGGSGSGQDQGSG
jgi:hypothetical protein